MVSEVWDQTLRKKEPVGRGNNTSDEDKLRILRALYIVAYTSEDSLVPIAVELFHLLGAVLEGTHAEDLEINSIDTSLFLRTVADMTSNTEDKHDNHSKAKPDSDCKGLESRPTRRHQRSDNVHTRKRTAATIAGPEVAETQA